MDQAQYDDLKKYLGDIRVFTSQIVDTLLADTQLNISQYTGLRKRLLYAVKDWGEAPKYNEDYRRVRWPGRQPGEQRPAWIRHLTYSIRKRKEIIRSIERRRERPGGRYQPLTHGRGIPSSENRNRATLDNLHDDLYKCIAHNIPFKTNTVEYRPSESIVYLCGDPTVKIHPLTGNLQWVCMGGTYDKRKAFLLRHLFFFDITKHGDKFVWKYSTPREQYREFHFTETNPVAYVTGPFSQHREIERIDGRSRGEHRVGNHSFAIVERNLGRFEPNPWLSTHDILARGMEQHDNLAAAMVGRMAANPAVGPGWITPPFGGATVHTERVGDRMNFTVQAPPAATRINIREALLNGVADAAIGHAWGDPVAFRNVGNGIADLLRDQANRPGPTRTLIDRLARTGTERDE